MPSSISNASAPFLDLTSFTADEAASSQMAASPAASAVGGSPFLSVYESEESGGAVDPNAEEYVTFLSELYDQGFDEAVFELINEAAALHDEQFADSSSERFLEEHFEPLAQEIDHALEAVAQRFGNTDPANIGESEIDGFLDQYTPRVELSPSFENFLDAIKKGLKKVAGKAVGLAKKGIAFAGKLALGPLFGKLKALIRPLLQRVLRFAIGKLPIPLRPVAQKLAARLGLLKEVEEDSSESEEEAAGDISQIQQEFNQQLGDLLFATSEVQQDLEVSNVITESRAPFVNSLSDLDEARDRFTGELSRLKDGEDPAPLLENFLPAILPVLKLGLKLIGREKVVKFLAKFLAKLIGRFVGPRYSTPLSRALVDAGLKLLNLETTPQDEERAARNAVAATVEDTVRRVAALPEYVLDNQELLEAFTVDAFEQAAAANLPQVLPEDVYAKRPELRETKSIHGAWVMLPMRGKKRYKKFCRVLRAKIPPHKARAVESFDGASLAEFLEDQLGMAPGSDFEADVHLYEAMPGTMLPEIARLERNTPGLGTDSEAAYGQMHPLTPEAAAALLGEPGLGSEIGSPRTVGRRGTKPGQRLYHLGIAGARPKLRMDHRRRGRLRRLGGLHLILNFPSRQIRVCIYISEVKAQAIAVKLRQKAPIGNTLTLLRELVDRGLLMSLGRGGHGRLKIIHETVSPEQALGGALRRIPALVLNRVRGHLREWLLKGLLEFLKSRAQQFIAAADAPADGVTLIATIDNPPGFDILRQALRGRVASLAGFKMSGGAPVVKIDVVAGHSNG